ncbi:MAG: hypothetical protein PWQ57_1440 [Desulfovibrionales bacterium]|jgi:hypothetical protein|nr:hypothetical protein [Desulfovibrionales bacterium]
MKKWFMILFAAFLTLSAVSPASAEKFKNKDTAVDRRDNSFGTRSNSAQIDNQGGPGNDTVISVQPKEKDSQDQNYEIGPVLVQPKVYE